MFHKLLAVANWMASIPNITTPPPFRLLQLGSAFWHSRALYVAARLELADALGDGQKSTREIADALALHEDHLYRLMRMLASIGIFEETGHRVFRNSKMSDYLRSDNPKSVRDMVLMHNDPVMTKPWTESLESCIRSGETPFVLSNGVDLYEYMNQNKEFDRLFSRAMDAVEGLTGDAYLDDFDWSRFDRLIDVGGSKGSKALAVLARHPKLEAVVFDRPQIIEEARTYWNGSVAPSVLKRLSFVGGDMLQDLPQCVSGRDVYMFMGVFHGMGDEDCAKVISRLRSAIGNEKPTILVVDAVAEATGIDPGVASFDMQMLMGTQGRERTLEEWTGLFEGTGLRIDEIVKVRTFARFIVVRPE